MSQSWRPRPIRRGISQLRSQLPAPGSIAATEFERSVALTAARPPARQVDQPDINKLTPLHRATMADNNVAAQILLQCKPNPTATARPREGSGEGRSKRGPAARGCEAV